MDKFLVKSVLLEGAEEVGPGTFNKPVRQGLIYCLRTCIWSLLHKYAACGTRPAYPVVWAFDCSAGLDFKSLLVLSRPAACSPARAP